MELTEPLYTLEEAAKLLNLTATDLRCEFKKSTITPILFCSQEKEFIILSMNKNRKKIGHSCFKYRGPLLIRKKLIMNIIEEDKGPFYAYYYPLDIRNVSNFNNQNPFQQPIPNYDFSSWKPLAFEESFSGNLGATLKPSEMKSLTKTLELLSQCFSKKSKNNPALNTNSFEQIPYVNNWQYQEDWTADDLRVPKSEIARYKNLQKSPQKPKVIPQGVSNLFINLIDRVLADNLCIKLQQFIDLIIQDVNQEVPTYDIYDSIEAIDNSSIEYRLTSGGTQEVGRKGIANNLSKRRKWLEAKK